MFNNNPLEQINISNVPEKEKKEEKIEVEVNISETDELENEHGDINQEQLRAEIKTQDLEKQQEEIKHLEENIENTKSQKEDYSDILDQQVEYTREQWSSGEARIISEDANAFTKSWKQFPVNPFVMANAGKGDYMVNELEKKNYSEESINGFKEQKAELKVIKKKIEDSLQKAKDRYSKIGFAHSNDISYPSFPYVSIGHGNHYFDSGLMNKQMSLGELFDKEIEIKTKQLFAAQDVLKEIEERE